MGEVCGRLRQVTWSGASPPKFWRAGPARQQQRSLRRCVGRWVSRALAEWRRWLLRRAPSHTARGQRVALYFWTRPMHSTACLDDGCWRTRRSSQRWRATRRQRTQNTPRFSLVSGSCCRRVAFNRGTRWGHCSSLCRSRVCWRWRWQRHRSRFWGRTWTTLSSVGLRRVSLRFLLRSPRVLLQKVFGSTLPSPKWCGEGLRAVCRSFFQIAWITSRRRRGRCLAPRVVMLPPALLQRKLGWTVGCASSISSAVLGRRTLRRRCVSYAFVRHQRARISAVLLAPPRLSPFVVSTTLSRIALRQLCFPFLRMRWRSFVCRIVLVVSAFARQSLWRLLLVRRFLSRHCRWSLAFLPPRRSAP